MARKTKDIFVFELQEKKKDEITVRAWLKY